MKKTLLTALLAGLLTTTAFAQFTGPSVATRTSTVAQANTARLGSYVTVTGNITSHLRGDYFMFKDATGEMRVEIEPEAWQGRKVGPDAKVRLHGEVGTGVAGRYMWVKTLDVVAP